MFICNECGTKLTPSNTEPGTVIECMICGIELEVAENTLLSRQLGPSEE